MYVAFSVTHEPIEAPDVYVDKYPKTIPNCRRIYNGMASAVDDAVKNITAALHSSGLWESTLVIWSSDNGGPSLVPGPSCANNYPMRYDTTQHGRHDSSTVHHRITNHADRDSGFLSLAWAS